MRRERLLGATLVVGAVWLGVLAGCGGGGGGENAGQQAEAPAPAADQGATPAVADSGAAGEVSLALGKKVVEERCVLCHGADGKGDGPGAAALNPKPRDWTESGYMESKTDDQLYESIYNGKSAMPAWGKTGVLSETEIRSAIKYVRTFDPKYKG
jgi:cytochrome c5